MSMQECENHHAAFSNKKPSYDTLVKRLAFVEAELTTLRARLAGCELNAARYEWLRSEDVATLPRYYPFWNEFLAKLTREDRMDSHIDKWMVMEFCEHEKDAANCGECHGQLGVGT